MLGHGDTDDGVTRFVISGHTLFFLGHHHGSPLGAHHDLILGALELFHADDALIGTRSE